MNEQKFKGGFNTLGTEDYFEGMLRRSISERTTPGFRYAEVGIAEGTTLASVAEVIRDSLPNQEWQAIGIDLFDGPFFNEKNFIKKVLSFDVVIKFGGRSPMRVNSRFDSDISIALMKGDAQRVLFTPSTINFALIDGCHGAPCVEKDFLAIEPGMAMGGIVAFHDAGIEDQGIHFQQHCQQPISVRKALFSLNLWPEAPREHGDEAAMRPSWKFIGHVDGDKSPGNLQLNGHGFVFFQRVKGAE